jgi:hypothetical protein
MKQRLLIAIALSAALGFAQESDSSDQWKARDRMRRIPADSIRSRRQDRRRWPTAMIRKLAGRVHMIGRSVRV